MAEMSARSVLMPVQLRRTKKVVGRGATTVAAGPEAHPEDDRVPVVAVDGA
jgi:hypothetical protein